MNCDNMSPSGVPSDSTFQDERQRATVATTPLPPPQRGGEFPGRHQALRVFRIETAVVRFRAPSPGVRPPTLSHAESGRSLSRGEDPSPAEKGWPRNGGWGQVM